MSGRDGWTIPNPVLSNLYEVYFLYGCGACDHVQNILLQTSIGQFVDNHYNSQKCNPLMHH